MTGITSADAVAVFLVVVKGLLALVGFICLVSGIDDFFVDLYHALTTAYRRLFVLRKRRPLTEGKLRRVPEKPVAIMIPAWDESAVIRQMLQATLTRIDYSNHHIFVGTYPNDPETGREVALVREKFKNVHAVVCPHDGPTNKADCLNAIYQGIVAFETKNAVEFEIFVMNDSEDLVHPLYLKLFNYLIPRKDMVQLPVIPMKTRWSDFTSGHYLDEFAENHSKDMLVREYLARVVPSAGVGCAFSRRALTAIAKQKRGQLFSVDTLTEDYDFGFRLRYAGMKQIFARVSLPRWTSRRSFWTGKIKDVPVRECIAIKEYFPSRFRAALRQKSRWVVGIALQGWVNLGWRGDLTIKYMFFRDRKGIVTNLASVIGYGVVAVVVTLWIIQWLHPDAYRYPPVVERGSWLWFIVLGNAFFLSMRLSQRAFRTGSIYGWKQGLLAMPRQVWGNFVNFAATVRALYLFGNHLVSGKTIGWDKTAHVYPTDKELAEQGVVVRRLETPHHVGA